MATPESIDRLLTVVAKLLDSSAAEVRDAPLEPVRENISRIGDALTQVFEVHDALYAAYPALKPAFLTEESSDSDSNRLLTEFLGRALGFERAGDIPAAIAELEQYTAVESSAAHIEIARGQIQRLQDAART